jgi:hypothetical protein
VVDKAKDLTALPNQLKEGIITSFS